MMYQVGNHIALLAAYLFCLVIFIFFLLGLGDKAFVNVLANQVKMSLDCEFLLLKLLRWTKRWAVREEKMYPNFSPSGLTVQKIITLNGKIRVSTAILQVKYMFRCI